MDPPEVQSTLVDPVAQQDNGGKSRLGRHHAQKSLQCRARGGPSNPQRLEHSTTLIGKPWAEPKNVSVQIRALALTEHTALGRKLRPLKIPVPHNN